MKFVFAVTSDTKVADDKENRNAITLATLVCKF